MKKIVQAAIAAALVVGGALAVASPASAAEVAPQSSVGVQTVGPVCSGGDVQHEWDPFPIQYWMWGRVSGDLFHGDLYTYYGQDVGWVQQSGYYRYCH